MTDEKEGSLIEQIKGLRDDIKLENNKKTEKKFRLPMKAKVGKLKLSKGYVIVVIFNENKVIEFSKVQIKDGSFKLGETVHSLEEVDLFSYKGKPIIFQSKTKLNPINPYKGSNETYGQDYVATKMLKDAIKPSTNLGILPYIIGGAVILGILYLVFSGGI